MFKLPVYSPSNYQGVISKAYSADACEWLDLGDFLAVLTDSVIASLQDANVTKLADFAKNSASVISAIPAGKFGSSENAYYAIKYLMPTLWACDYFIWNVGKGKHHGIDIMLPQGTPLVSLCDGEVTKAKKRDGAKKDDGNCVVIKSSDGLFYCYQHMDIMSVTVGAKVKIGDVIGTCGKTGNATQYHLHLQIDTSAAPFHPYWSANQSDILKYTSDPIKVLRNSPSSSDNSASSGGDLLDDISKSVGI